MNMFCFYHFFRPMHRYRATVADTVGDSNFRHTTQGSSKVKVDGTIRKSAYEFLFESVKKNDAQRTFPRYRRFYAEAISGCPSWSPVGSSLAKR